MPAACLLAKSGSRTCELFELGETGEGVNALTDLEPKLQIVHRTHQVGDVLDLMRAITPRPVCYQRNVHGLLTKSSTKAVFEGAAESSDSLFDIDQ